MILNVQCEKRRWAPPSDDAKTTEAPKLEEGEDRTKLENITSAILGLYDRCILSTVLWLSIDGDQSRLSLYI